MVVSQFMRDMSVAEPAVIEAAIHPDAGHAHRVNTKATHVTDAEAADMGATNDAHVNTSEAADVAATKTTTATRKGGTTSHRYSNHRGCDDCENFAVNLGFHNLAPFSLVSNQSWA
jgi:cytochrome c